MVKHGQFCLGLVRAETGAPYDEHGAPNPPGGFVFNRDIYAEVEPEDEYYLSLRSDAPEVVYADLSVDGKVIQKGHQLRTGRTSKVGIIRADSHAGETRTTEVALRFARAKVHAGTGNDGRADACEYWTGQVEATFYGNPIHRIPPGATPKPETNEDVFETATVAPAAAAPAPAASGGVTYAKPSNTFFLNPELASSDVGYVPGKSAETQKKGVKSAEGTTALRTLNLNWEPRRETRDWDDCSDLTSSVVAAPRARQPERLGTVTLRYCSTVGLIHAGILEKPPNWEEERLKLTCSKRTREEHARILRDLKVQRFELMSERITGTGEKVVEKKEVEVLDLT